MDIEYINNREPDWPLSSKSRIEHALGISRLLIKTIRRISFSISPNMLEHHVFNATLNWHCKEISILNGILCSFESAYDETNLTEETKIDLFRICQESLMNILLHAQANHVKILIEEAGDQIQLTVHDDGKRFEIDNQTRKSGLTPRRQPAASLNGQ